MNQFEVTILPDGKIRVTSPGGFSKDVHADADRFLDLIKDLAAGDVETKQLKPTLGNPHAQSMGHGMGHKH